VKPTIGRIVHYTNSGERDGKYSPEVHAALGINSDGIVVLPVFHQIEQFDMPSVEHTVVPAAPHTPRLRVIQGRSRRGREFSRRGS
jgi:hypothetical protein